MQRRTFFKSAAAGMLGKAAGGESRFDFAVIGGGTGGVAAALAALRSGLRVVMTEPTRWIGGQLTSQGVPPDEHAWIEQFGRTALYAEYRNRVRRFYREEYRLRPEAARARYLNPGGGLVSGLTHEPRVSWLVLEGMLTPYRTSGQLTVLLEHRPVAALVQQERVEAVTLRGPEREVTVSASYFVDATEMGDLLPLTKTEFVTGFESRRDTGEPSAPEQAQPANLQAFTWCFAAEYREGEDHTIDRPAQYGFWRDYVPKMRPAWPGKLLSWQMSNPVTLAVRDVSFDPSGKGSPSGPLNLWLYRRIVDKGAAEGIQSDVTLVNWPQNDYWLGNPFDDPKAADHLRGSRELSLSLLYWMQTEAPRPDGGQGWKGLRPRGDVLGTDDGLSMYPYIRESRRIKAEFTVLEQHVGTDARAKALSLPKDQVSAEVYPDSVGVGSYRIDLHPSTGGDNYVDVSSLPFQIPLGALIPRARRNLLAAAKNIGTTHITNGCYRLHPVEWNAGESAGYLVAECLRTGETPSGIRNQAGRLEAFQRRIREAGVETAWPRLSPR
jgi:hypothetical protein